MSVAAETFSTWTSPDGAVRLFHGDNLLVLPALEAESIDSIVCDPPYGLAFMGREWDHGVPGVPFWEAALRVAKPGAHLLAFGGTRTFHRLMCAIEDGGWELRDTIMWVFASGFPKSLDVSKAIDKAAGVDREDKFEGSFERHAGPTGNKKCEQCGKWLISGSPCQCPRPQDAAVTEAAKQWKGWGTALKPAWEPIVVARKPLAGTVAENVQQHDTGGINIDASRVPVEDEQYARNCSGDRGFAGTSDMSEQGATDLRPGGGSAAAGRWPANLLHDGSDEVLAGFPRTRSGKPAGVKAGGKLNCYGEFAGGIPVTGFGDEGSAARFFFCAKASQADRDEGLEHLADGILARPCQAQAEAKRGNTVEEASGAFNKARIRKNTHPTVKPTALMRYLVRLVTPPGGIVLDNFTGSGSTGKAAVLEGFRFVGIEMTNTPDEPFFEIAKGRIQAAIDTMQPALKQADPQRTMFD